MCQKCLDAVERLLPNIAKEDRLDLLLEATSFPMGMPDYIEKQVQELAENTDGTFGGAMMYAAKALEEESRKFRERA